MGKELGELLRRQKQIPRPGGVGLSQARELGIEGDGAQHPVQLEVPRLQQDRPAGGDGGQAELAGKGQRPVQLVARGELDVEVLFSLAAQGGEDFALVGKNGQAAAVVRQRAGELEVAAAVQLGEEPAEVGVPLGVAGQKHRPRPAMDRLGADQRPQPAAPRLIQEVRDGVEAVAVGQRQGGKAELPGRRAELGHRPHPPLGRGGGVEVEGDVVHGRCHTEGHWAKGLNPQIAQIYAD